MFVFRLESVLKHRARKVEEEARRLRRIEASLLDLRARRSELESRRKQLSCSGGPGRDSCVDIQQWRRLSDYLERLRRRRDELLSAEREMLERANEQRRKLCEAQRECEVLEKLRDRQLASWSEEQRRSEQKELDDVGGRAFWGRGRFSDVVAKPGGVEA